MKTDAGRRLAEVLQQEGLVDEAALEEYLRRIVGVAADGHVLIKVGENADGSWIFRVIDVPPEVSDERR